MVFVLCTLFVVCMYYCVKELCTHMGQCYACTVYSVCVHCYSVFNIVLHVMSYVYVSVLYIENLT